MLRGVLVAASLCILLPIGGGNEAFDDATDVCSCADGSTYLYDADCLDAWLCLECQPCQTRCCLGTGMWAQLSSKSPWGSRSGHAVVSTRLPGPRHSVIVMGGKRPPAANETTAMMLADVWESQDGVAWTEVSFSMIWSRREGMAAAEHNGSIWVAGGVGPDGDCHSDLWVWDRWQHEDATWTLVTGEADWGKLSFASLVILPLSSLPGGLNDTTMFLLGGRTCDMNTDTGTNTSHNLTNSSSPVSPAPAEGSGARRESGNASDSGGQQQQVVRGLSIWSSVNGTGWIRMPDLAGGKATSGWSAIRHMPSSRVPLMIVLGGEDASGQMVGQVMNSADGISWSDVSPQTSSAAQRRNVAFVSDGYQIVIAGGESKAEGSYELKQDVLVSFNHCHKESCAFAGSEWTPGTLSAQWTARKSAHLVDMGDFLLLLGGSQGGVGDEEVPLSDVWVTQQRCRKGTVGPACRPCEPGTLSTAEGAATNAVCEPCPLGHEAPDKGSSTCKPCAKGFFSNTTGKPSCSPCPKGYISDSEASESCTACAPGTHQSFPGKTECVECPTRYYCPEGSGDPTGCPLGSYTEYGLGKSLDSCTCLGGFFSVTGSAPCTACDKGTYQQSQGSTSCIACASGKTTSSDASVLDTECKSVEPPPPPSSTPQQATFKFRMGIAAESASVNKSIAEYILAIATAAEVAASQVSLTDLKGMASGPAGYTDASFSIIVGVRDLQEVSASFQLEALNAELTALKLDRAYAIVPAGSVLPVAQTPPPSSSKPTSQVPPSATEDTDVISESPTESPELEENAEQTFAMAALILCVVAAVIFGCYKVYSRLRFLRRSHGESEGGAKSPASRGGIRRIEMRQLPLVFKSKSARSNGYERTALVANPADEEDVEPE